MSLDCLCRPLRLRLPVVLLLSVMLSSCPSMSWGLTLSLSPSLTVQDEGVTLGVAKTFNCAGNGILCEFVPGSHVERDGVGGVWAV